jgi:hypothetical protein
VLASTTSALASDASATETYIQANYTLAKAGVSRIGAVQAKIEALNSRLAHECPGVGTGSPQNEASQPMAHEVVAAMWAITYGANAGSIATFVSKTKHLRWSNGKITRMVSAYGTSLHVLATLALPDICSDVKAWKATGFTAVPPKVAALDDRAESATVEPVPAKLLAPFEHGGEAHLMTRTAGLELKLEESEFSLGQSDWAQILATLGLQS